MRNEAADRFANCVVGRTEYDLILRMSLLVFTSFVMPLVAGLATAFLCNNYVGEGVLSKSSSTIAYVVFAGVFFSIISFIMLSMVGRARSHMIRDREWRASLVDYASSKGCDVSALDGSDMDVGRYSMSTTRIMSMICWITTLLLLALMLFSMSVEALRDYPALIALLVYFMILFQFFFVMGPTIRFAGNHEAMQVEFTRQLKSVLASKGIFIESMSPAVPRSHRFIWLVLTIITLGLFHVVLVIYSIYALNRHMYNQWAYEEGLLQDIIKAEGATGVEVIPKTKE